MNRSGLKALIASILNACRIFTRYQVIINKVMDFLLDQNLITSDQHAVALGLFSSIVQSCTVLELIVAALDAADF